ncbi:hypothetical protein LEP1GSC040_0349 [Leptospira santarosai str. 2000030832]|nr:hypothetical protein LEP1GSC040_0349 [Leptospira santarosai str. 2000030832]
MRASSSWTVTSYPGRSNRISILLFFPKKPPLEMSKLGQDVEKIETDVCCL